MSLISDLAGWEEGEEEGRWTKKRNKPLCLRLKCSRNTANLQNGLHHPLGVIRVMIFPSGGRECENPPRWEEVSALALKLPGSTCLSSCHFIFFFSFFAYPSLFHSAEATPHCTTGSDPTNWGQCRIELHSYGLIYMSVSADRRGNRIFPLTNPSWVLCTANIVWTVRFKPFIFSLVHYFATRPPLLQTMTKRIRSFWQSNSHFHTYSTFASPSSSFYFPFFSPPHYPLIIYPFPPGHTHTQTLASHHNVWGLFGVRRRPYVLFTAKVSLILPVQQSERGAWAHCSLTPWKEGAREWGRQESWMGGRRGKR